jgi:transcriptional regulator with XRE-family HTH domain
MATKGSDIYLPHLRAWRADQGLTQRELAEKAGVSVGTVLRAEAGGPMRVNNIAKLARALGISVHDLRHVDPEQHA